MDHGITGRLGIVAIAIVGILATAHGDDRSEALERARRRAAEGPRQGSKQRAPLQFPRQEAIAGGLSAEGALWLWPQFSAALHDRMYRANRKVALNVIGCLQGVDMSVGRATDERQRGIALAQIQAACAMFLSTPGIPLLPTERDLLAAYGAKSGEARASQGKKR